MLKNYEVVAVLNKSLNQILSGAKIIKAEVKEESKVMSHPVESGQTIEDEIVFQPVEVTLNMVLDPSSYRATYQEIKGLYTKREIITVQTKVNSYNSLVIESLPHDEDSSLFDTIAIAIRLKEVRFVETEYEAYTPTKVRNPADASTKKTGEAKTEDASGKLGSIAGKFGKAIGL